MKRLVSVILAVILSIAAAAPASAHSQGYPVPYMIHPGAGFNYYIPVCLHNNISGWTGDWNLSDPVHATINRALHLWDDYAVATGGELYFYRSNTECGALAAEDVPYVQVGYSGYDIGAVMRTDTYHELTSRGSRVMLSAIWINEVGENFYYGTGTPSANDAWTMLGHEFGHASQIAHYVPDFCGQGLDIMVSCFSAGQTNRALSSHDKSHYNYWYDAGSSL